MIANLGYGALFITFLVSIYSAIAAVYGARRNDQTWIESARRATLLTFPLLTISALSIIILLVNGSYGVEYVASVTSNSMPAYLRITALWGGQAGSLVFWSWVMSAFTSAVTLRKWERDREFLPWVILVTMITLAFFLILALFVENPFERIWISPTGMISTSLLQPAGTTLFSPQDGQGLNPLLRHYGMVIHPPLLYLGFVSFVIPYAFAIAALITGRTDDRWIRVTRRWTLIAWLFLSLGLIMGGRWAYDVLGWGGYWAWDPVETSSLLPWLSGTAFLHSVVIQEKRGLLKHWNMILIIITYDLVIFGTFLTRSGVLSSVHAFAQSAIGPLFFSFITITFIASLILLGKRWNELKSKTYMTSVLSREAFFLANNWLFTIILVICFLGVIYPVLTEALGLVGQQIPALSGIFSGQKATVGPEWYERITVSFFALLLLLMGIAPLSAWKHSTVKTLVRGAWKPFAASLVILGIVLAVGVRHWGALLGFWLIAFAGSVTLYEFGRAAWARSRSHSENPLLAIWTLAGRNRRRYGGYIIHLSMVLMAIGIIGIEMYQSQTQGTIAQGESITLGRYSITFDGLYIFNTDDGRNVALAEVSVYRDGEYLGKLQPRRDYYIEAQQPMTIPGVRSSMEDDFYVILVDWQPVSTGGATFKVYHNPLVNWMWLGGFMIILGVIVAIWPDKEPEMEAKAIHQVVTPAKA